MEKISSQLDADGYFVGVVIADESPLEPGVFLIPGGAVDLPPPEAVAGKRYRPDGLGGWEALEDNRGVETFLVSSGAPYTSGQAVEGERYDGTGPLPVWLTFSPRPNEWSKWDGQAWIEDKDARDLIVRQQNASSRTSKIANAATAIAPLQDAVDIGLATAKEVELLNAWKLYRVMLNRVDIEESNPDWPIEPT